MANNWKLADNESTTFTIVASMCEDFGKKFIEFPTKSAKLLKSAADVVYDFATSA